MAVYTLECAPESRGTGMSGSSCDPATPPCQLTAAVGNSIGIAAVSGSHLAGGLAAEHPLDVRVDRVVQAVPRPACSSQMRPCTQRISPEGKDKPTNRQIDTCHAQGARSR